LEIFTVIRFVKKTLAFIIVMKKVHQGPYLGLFNPDWQDI